MQCLQGHEGDVNGVGCNRTGTLAVTGSDDLTVRVWDLEGERLLHTLRGHEHAVRAVAVFQNQDIAVSGDESGRLFFWDIREGRELGRIECYSNDREYAEATRHLWDVTTGPAWLPSPKMAEAPAIEGLSVSPDGHWLVIAQRNSVVNIWDAVEQREHGVLHGHSGIVFAAAVATDSRRVASACTDRTVRVWDLVTSRSLCTFTADAPLYCCALTPDSGAVLAGEGGGHGTMHFLQIEGAEAQPAE
ncbi:WD40 repeat domain-containing protein [Planctomycetota bacterium]